MLFYILPDIACACGLKVNLELTLNVTQNVCQKYLRTFISATSLFIAATVPLTKIITKSMFVHRSRSNHTFESIGSASIISQSSISPISSFTCRSFNRLNHSYSRKRRDVTTWRVAKRRYQGVENKPLICIAV